MAAKKDEKEKPLDKMTVKDLREIAKTLPDVVGVHGMNKGDLLKIIKEHRGIKDEPGKRKSGSVRDIKAKIKVFKRQRQEALAASDRKKAVIIRRKLARLKKKSRQAA